MNRQEMLDEIDNYLALKENMLVDQFRGWVGDQIAHWFEVQFTILREDVAKYVEALFRAGEASEM